MRPGLARQFRESAAVERDPVDRPAANVFLRRGEIDEPFLPVHADHAIDHPWPVSDGPRRAPGDLTDVEVGVAVPLRLPEVSPAGKKLRRLERVDPVRVFLDEESL